MTISLSCPHRLGTRHAYILRQGSRENVTRKSIADSLSHFGWWYVIHMESNYFNNDIFIENYDKYADAIFRYCSYRVFDRERARELMQETFTKTWEYMEKGNQIENLRAFLYKVAHNLCVNEVIHPKPYSLDEMNEKVDFDPKDENMAPIEREAEISLLNQKMQMLKPEENEILTMRYINDLAVSEIADILQMLPNTVSIKIQRAEEALKKLYK